MASVEFDSATSYVVGTGDVEDAAGVSAAEWSELQEDFVQGWYRTRSRGKTGYHFGGESQSCLVDGHTMSQLLDLSARRSQS
jgi:hypothetical protein